MSAAQFGAGGYNSQLASVGIKATAPYFVGTAFGCGGYFQAELAFVPSAIEPANGFPAWWSMSVEHLIPDTTQQQWQGQPTGYAHFGEVDFMEAIQGGNPDQYDATLHDWYGLYGVTCTQWCEASSTNNSVRSGVDLKQYHYYGTLWIPATATTPGSVSFYLDGNLINSGVTWTQFANQAPPPGPGAPWTFGIIDQQHLALTFGSGSAPITVRSVNVWQNGSACNVTH